MAQYNASTSSELLRDQTATGLFVSATRCFEISHAALQQLGAGLEDVSRTRILLPRIENWKAVAEVHGEFFCDIRPVNTIMQVSRFIGPDWLIETEVDAVVTEE